MEIIKKKRRTSNFADDLSNAYESSSKLILFKMITDLDDPAVHYCIITQNSNNSLYPVYLNKKTVKSFQVDTDEVIIDIYITLKPSEKVETVKIPIASITEILKFTSSPFNEAAVVFENTTLHIPEIKNGIIKKASVVKRDGMYAIRFKIDFVSFADIYGNANSATIQFTVKDLDVNQRNKAIERTLSVFGVEEWKKLVGLEIRLKGKVFYPVTVKQKAFMPDFILGNSNQDLWLTQQLDTIMPAWN